MAITTVGVFSKESAIVITAVIALYELTWWRERNPGGALLLGSAATLLPIAVMLYQRSVVIATSMPAEYPFTDNPIVGTDFWAGRLTAIKVIARYLCLKLWPARLSCDRKNSLFVGNPRGGRTAAILASLTSTCRRHQVDPQLYLTQLLMNLPSWPARDLDAWLPDQWKLQHTAHLASLNHQKPTAPHNPRLPPRSEHCASRIAHKVLEGIVGPKRASLSE